MSILVFSSCEKVELIDDSVESGEVTKVRIVTRAPSASDNVYPLRIYAFAEDGRLFDSRVIQSDDEKVSVQVPLGATSRVVALSADEATYVIPNATSSEAIVECREPQLPPDASSFAHNIAKGYVSSSPLQMAFADITPTSASATLNLQMHYHMASIRFVLSALPDLCTTAYVTVASPYENITLGGDYAGSQKSAIPLFKDKEKDLWDSGEVYLFPTGSSQTNFTIAYDDADGEQFAQVTYESGLRAGTPYILYGTLLDGTLNVTGDVTPAQWGTPETLQFTFSPDKDTTIGGNSSEEGEGPVYEVEVVPEPLTLWKNHVVIGVETNDASSATLTLVSTCDFDDVTSSFNASTPHMAQELADGYEEYGLNSWHIPSENEARRLREVYLSATDVFENLMEQAEGGSVVLTDSKGNNIRYLCADAAKTYSFKAGSAYNAIKDAGASVTNYHLRLVSTVQVKIK